MNGYWIEFANDSGVLDRVFARTEEQAREVAVKMLNCLPYLCDGDSIFVRQGWSDDYIEDGTEK